MNKKEENAFIDVIKGAVRSEHNVLVSLINEYSYHNLDTGIFDIQDV